MGTNYSTYWHYSIVKTSIKIAVNGCVDIYFGLCYFCINIMVNMVNQSVVKYLYSTSLFKMLLFACMLPLSGFSKQKSDVTLVAATYENWTAGINGGGSGKEYYFKIAILSSDKIIFDSLWVGNKSFKTYLSNNKKTISSSPIVFFKNDTIIVRASEMDNHNYHNSKLPLRYKGDALLRYYTNGKQHFIKIKSIVLLQNPNRP